MQQLCAPPTAVNAATLDLPSPPAAAPYAPTSIRSGHASDQGRRRNMEDASVAVDDVKRLAAAGGGPPPSDWAESLKRGGNGCGFHWDGGLAGGANAAAAACGDGGNGGAAAGQAAPAWVAAPGLPAVGGFYAVFDGHCGSSAAQFAAARAFQHVIRSPHFPAQPVTAMADAFLSIEHDYFVACSGGGAAPSGTTALAALVWGGRVVLANAGDSRAVICRRGKAIELTTDHKPGEPGERVRIERSGGYVCEDGLLCGELAVARAIGDYHLEDLKRANSRPGALVVGPLTAEPEVTQHRLEGPEDEFILLGCDGVWDVFSSQRAVEFARQRLRRHNDPQRCAEELVAEALRMHSSDNLTVVVVCLGDEPPPARLYSGSALSASASRRNSLDGSRRDPAGGAPGAASGYDSLSSSGPSAGPSPVLRPLPSLQAGGGGGGGGPPSPLQLDGGAARLAGGGTLPPAGNGSNGNGQRSRGDDGLSKQQHLSMR